MSMPTDSGMKMRPRSMAGVGDGGELRRRQAFDDDVAGFGERGEVDQAAAAGGSCRRARAPWPDRAPTTAASAHARHAPASTRARDGEADGAQAGDAELQVAIPSMPCQFALDSCIGIADALVRRHGMPAGDARQQRIDVVGAAGAHGAVEEQLLQHVLLRVAAAEAVHAGKGRPHQVAGARGIALGAGDQRLADRQRAVAHQRRGGACSRSPQTRACPRSCARRHPSGRRPSAPSSSAAA